MELLDQVTTKGKTELQGFESIERNRKTESVRCEWHSMWHSCREVYCTSRTTVSTESNTR